MKENQLFTRYEFKYLISNKIAGEIFNQSLNFMKLDEFALENKAYDVRSLYYDNYDFDNFFEKVDGIKFRKKFRIRTYGKKFQKLNPIYLEAKGRVQDRIFKKRFKIESEDLTYFYSIKKTGHLLNKYKNNQLIKEFIYDTYKKRIKPRVLIDYKRKPLVNKHGLYFRLTFDSELISAKSKVLFNEKFFFPQECKSGFTILEVKFERSIPAWFHRTIQAYDLRRESISKFVYGVCNCKIKEETSD